MKNKRGMTLIALVITIIVLIILAGVSITMLTGDNSILNRAVEAKEKTEVAEVEEALRMAYTSLVTSNYVGEESTSFSNTIEKVKEQGYEIEDGVILKLDKDAVILGMNAAANKTEVINVVEEHDKYYAKLSGKYYEVTMKNDSINVSKEASNIILKNNTGEDTIEVSTKDSSISTVLNNGKVITATAKKAGNTSLVVKINGKTLPNIPVTVLDSLTQVNLDGAMFLKTSFAENETVTVEDTRFATVTQDKAIKCTQKEGTTLATITAEDGTETKYKIKSTAKIVYTPTSNSTLNGQAKGPYNPTVPVGFSAIDTKDAKWNLNGEQTDVNKGLVIMDNEGNQFVWIPVPTVVAETEEAGTENKAMAVKLANGNYRGLLYNFSKAEDGTLSSSVMEGCTTTTESYREPDVTWMEGSDYINTVKQILADRADEYKDKSTFTKTLQKEYNDVISSVSNYGGFYIGRYQSSVLYNSTRIISGLTSMRGTRGGTTYPWHELFARQKDYSKNLETVEACMVWGSQWDAMMNWMINQGINVKSSNPNGASKNTTRITGSEQKDKINNIYDLLGNCVEFSMETYLTHSRISRGGEVWGSWGCNAPCIRYSTQGTYAYFSSRPTLYIIEN